MYKEKKSIPVKKVDDLSMVTAAQRAAGSSLANMSNTTTKKLVCGLMNLLYKSI